jgi:flagellin
MGFQNGFRVNTNTSAVNTYRSYSTALSGLERIIERLSSGLRINRAADDTAGSAISQRMSNQARGMQQANRNVQQANNMLQTAEGGLNQIHGILARMRELAVQSASDGVNSDDRSSIDLEFQSLKAEISRIGDRTEYNGMKLINGQRAKNLNAMPTKDQSGATLSLTGSDIDTAETNSIGGNAANDNTISNVKASSFVANGIYKLSRSSAPATATAPDYVTYTLTLTHSINPDGSATAIDAADQARQTIYRAGSKGDGFGDVDGDQIYFDDLGIVTLDNLVTDDGDPNSKNFTVDDGNFMTIQVGANNDAGKPSLDASVGANVTENRITFNLADATSEGLAIANIDLDSLGEAQSAINSLDAAIAKVNDERSNIGSLQNRFEFASSNLMNSIQNTDASQSTIVDADFAVEAADLARNQILTQSGTAMLAQASQISQNVLSLLK